MYLIKRALTVICLLLPAILSAWTDWQTLSTTHFTVFYKAGWETEAINVLQTMEYSRPFAETLTGNNSEKTPIVLQDMGNLVNGYTDPIGNKIALFCYPPTNDELALCEDWWQLVGVHEYLHMLQMTKAGGIPKFLRLGLGNVFYPQLHQPMWMTEGITVFGESNLSPFSGRLNSGSYRPLISALAKEARLPSPAKAAYYSFDTPLAHYYVFGGSFYSYLSQTYGADKFAALFADNSSRLAAYLNGIFPALALDRAFQNIYGKPLSYLWSDWQQSEAGKPFIMPSRPLTTDGWNTSDLQVYNGEIYYLKSKAIKTGPGSSFYTHQLHKVSSVRANTADLADSDADLETNSLADSALIVQNTEFPAGYHFANGMLYYTRLENKRGFANTDNDGYGNITELWQMDLEDRSVRRLYEGQFRAFYPLEDGSFLISEDSATHQSSTLYNILPCCKTKTELLKSDKLIHGIIADQSRIFVTARSYWQNSSIYEFDSTSKALTPIVDTPYWEVLTSVQGDTLIYNAVYDGQMGAYQYRLSSGKVSRYSGYSDLRNPVSTDANHSYFISVNSKGYDVYQDNLTLTPYTLPTQLYAPPAYPRLEYSGQNQLLGQFPVKKGNYLDNLKHLAIPHALHAPMIWGTSDSLAIGFTLLGSDVVGDFPSWSSAVFYDTYQEKLVAELTLENDFFRPLHHSLRYSNLDDQTVSSTQYLTLYQSLNYGLRGVSAGFSFTSFEDYSRKLWDSFLDASFSWAYGELTTKNVLNIESKNLLPSDRNRLGWQGFYHLRQKSSSTCEFDAGLTLAYDPDADFDEVFWRIRGYEDAMQTNKGATLRATWYKPILKIREGLWNPQIYVEDISLGFFADTALPLQDFDALAQYSGGVELISELSSFYYLTTNAGFRFSYNRDQDFGVEFILGTEY